MVATTERKANTAGLLRPPREVGPAFVDAELERYARDGYAVARKLFSDDEVEALKGHYMRLRHAGRMWAHHGGASPSGPSGPVLTCRRERR